MPLVLWPASWASRQSLKGPEVKKDIKMEERLETIVGEQTIQFLEKESSELGKKKPKAKININK